MEILRLSGSEARQYAKEIGELRLKVFFDYPYLYEGNLEYEMEYLETYFKAKHSIVVLLKEDNKIIGATTGIWAKEEEESFREPFRMYGLNPDEVFYFGESVLLSEYRGKGYGKIFFAEREKFARTLPFIKYLSFCGVVREGHPLKPKDYRPLDSFWQMQGFKKAEGLVTDYHWKDRGEKEETNKKMQYWMKEIK